MGLEIKDGGADAGCARGSRGGKNLQTGRPHWRKARRSARVALTKGRNALTAERRTSLFGLLERTRGAVVEAGGGGGKCEGEEEKVWEVGKWRMVEWMDGWWSGGGCVVVVVVVVVEEVVLLDMVVVVLVMKVSALQHNLFFLLPFRPSSHSLHAGNFGSKNSSTATRPSIEEQLLAIFIPSSLLKGTLEPIIPTLWPPQVHACPRNCLWIRHVTGTAVGTTTSFRLRVSPALHISRRDSAVTAVNKGN
jgi:hypothetical protein